MEEQTLADVLMQDGPEEVEEHPEDVSEESEETKAEESASAVADKAGADGLESQASDEGGENKPDAPQKKKRLGGWQRQTIKARQEAEYWREIALGNRPAPAKDPAPSTSDDDKEVTLPTFSEYCEANPNGTIADYDKLVKEFPAKLDKWLESNRQKAEVHKQTEAALVAFSDQLADLPELGEIKAAIRSAQLPKRLVDFMALEASKSANGAAVFKEAMLDAELRDEFLRRDKISDGTGIASLINTIAVGLRIANRKSATQEKEPPEPPKTRAPKPLVPVNKPTVTDNSLRDDLPIDEWKKRRNAQVYGK